MDPTGGQQPLPTVTYRYLPLHTVTYRYSLGESAAYLAKSPYIRDLFVLVTAYGMSINLVEVTWKSKLTQAFPRDRYIRYIPLHTLHR